MTLNVQPRRAQHRWAPAVHKLGKRGRAFAERAHHQPVVAWAHNLAREWLMPTIRSVISESHKAEFRIVEFNVLANHLHLICEANSAVARCWAAPGVAP